MGNVVIEPAADFAVARDELAVAETLDAGVAAAALTPPGPIVLQGRLSARTASFPTGLCFHWIALSGLGVVVWLTLYLVLSSSVSVDLVATTTFATAVWLPCLETARRAVPPSIGRSFAAATGTAAGVVLGSALQTWLHFLASPLPPLTLLMAASAVFAVTTGWWFAVDHAGSGQRVMIVGTSGSAAEAAAELAAANSDRFEIVGAVDAGGDEPTGAVDEPCLSTFTEVLRAQHPDVLVVADERSCGEVIDPLLDLGAGSPRVVGLTGFFEHSLGRVPVDHLGVTWFMSLLHLKQRPHSRLAKRLFDLIGAVTALVVLSPLLAIIALLIRRTPGPVLYRQTRVGQGGALFEIYKFRTMQVDAEEPGCCRWACHNDPRVTGIGRLLRRTHIDELPQLWNVVRGEMSLVGPRPERPAFVEELERAVPFWGRRLLIKPGLTGWAQLHSGYASDADGAAAKLSYDLWYLRHRNVLLDLAICVKTLTSAFGIAGGR